MVLTTGLQAKRNFLDRLYVWRDIVAADSVAERRSGREETALIVKRDAETVDLELGDIVEFSPIGETLATLGERPEIVEIV